MKLEDQKFLFLDCQTTGMRPPRGQLLELAWSYSSALTSNSIESYLLKLLEGNELPRKVSELTGIQESDLEHAVPTSEVLEKLKQTIELADKPLTAIIHYAQFEKPFLSDLFGSADLPFSVLCTHQLVKKLFPDLPSPNIRGAAGFFGAPIDGIKRGEAHVRATEQIWKGLQPALEKQGLHSISEIQGWMETAPKAKRTRYEYRLDKLTRLSLPDSPGIYRMISKSGEVLYVGKATSLKSRVNSYFRGQKNRNRQKLEMLSQVWDLRVTSCETPLEAALLETDEIKRLNPPYNIVLKRGQRHLLFYNHDFSKANRSESTEFSIGPFRNHNWIEHLRLLANSLEKDEFVQIFFNPIPPENMKEGFKLLLLQHNKKETKSVRQLLAWGLQLHRNYEEPAEDEAIEEDESEESDIEQELSIEEIAAKFERLLRRSAVEYLRSQELTRLLDSDITLHLKSGLKKLRFQHGTLLQDKNYSSTQELETPWKDLTIDDYDRMSILRSELVKYEYEIGDANEK